MLSCNQWRDVEGETFIVRILKLWKDKMGRNRSNISFKIDLGRI